MLQWPTNLCMVTSAQASAISRRLLELQGVSIRSRLSIAGFSLSTVPGTWSATLNLASKSLADLLESEEASKATFAFTELSWSAMGLPAYLHKPHHLLSKNEIIALLVGVSRAQAAAIARPAASDSD